MEDTFATPCWHLRKGRDLSMLSRPASCRVSNSTICLGEGLHVSAPSLHSPHLQGGCLCKPLEGADCLCLAMACVPCVHVLVKPAAQANITGQDWFDLLAQFARAHTRSVAVMPTDEYGAPAPPHPWIDEDLHPDLGYWYIRDYLYRCAAACKINRQCKKADTMCQSLGCWACFLGWAQPPAKLERSQL